MNSTRFRGYLLLVLVVFAEGVIASFFPAFPFVAAAGIQAGAFATYVTGRTWTDTKSTTGGS